MFKLKIAIHNEKLYEIQSPKPALAKGAVRNWDPRSNGEMFGEVVWPGDRV